MIVLTLLGAVGVFARFYYRYDASMDEHEAVASGRGAGSGPPLVDDDDRDADGRRLMSDPNASPTPVTRCPRPICSRCVSKARPPRSRCRAT